MENPPLTDANRAAAVEDLKKLLSQGRISAEEFANRSRAIEQPPQLRQPYAIMPPSSTPSMPTHPLLSLAAAGFGVRRVVITGAQRRRTDIDLPDLRRTRRPDHVGLRQR